MLARSALAEADSSAMLEIFENFMTMVCRTNGQIKTGLDSWAWTAGGFYTCFQDEWIGLEFRQIFEFSAGD